MEPGERHYSLVAELLGQGEIVPFLGAGANLCDRPDETASWAPGEFAPERGGAREDGSPTRAATRTRTSTSCASRSTSTRSSARAGCTGTCTRSSTRTSRRPRLHRLFARLPSVLRKGGHPQLLLLTTNYDDLLERAFDEAGEAFDVVWYEAKRGPMHGRFMHRPPSGDIVPIERAERVHRRCRSRSGR